MNVQELALKITGDGQSAQTALQNVGDKLKDLVTNLTDVQHVAETAAAAFVAITGAIVAMGVKGSEVADVGAGFDRLAGGASNATAVLQAMRDGVAGTIDDLQLMTDANHLLATGVKASADDFGTMTAAARVLSREGFGSMQENMQAIDRAMEMGTARRLALKGVIVDTAAAEKAYAVQIGQSGEPLSHANKLIADRQAIVAALTKTVQGAGDQELSFAEKVEKGKTALENWFLTLSKAVAESVDVNRALDAIGAALSAAFGSDGQTLMDALVSGINSFARGITAAVPYVVALAHGIEDLFEFLYQIRDAIEFVAIALGAYAIVTGVVSLATTTFNGIMALEAGAMKLVAMSGEEMGAGMTAALGPIGLVALALAAMFEAWKLASKETGWIREFSDGFEYASLRVQGFTAAQADAMIATDHATQKEQEHVKAVGKYAVALEQANTVEGAGISATTALGDAHDEAAGKMSKFAKAVETIVQGLEGEGKKVKETGAAIDQVIKDLAAGNVSDAEETTKKLIDLMDKRAAAGVAMNEKEKAFYDEHQAEGTQEIAMAEKVQAAWSEYYQALDKRQGESLKASVDGINRWYDAQEAALEKAEAKGQDVSELRAATAALMYEKLQAAADADAQHQADLAQQIGALWDDYYQTIDKDASQTLAVQIGAIDKWYDAQYAALAKAAETDPAVWEKLDALNANYYARATKAEDDYAKQQQKYADETSNLWQQAFEIRTKLAGDTVQAQMDGIDQWFNNEVAKLKEDDAEWEAHYDALYALQQAKKQEIKESNDFLGKGLSELGKEFTDLGTIIGGTFGIVSAGLGKFIAGIDSAQTKTTKLAQVFGPGAFGGIFDKGGTFGAPTSRLGQAGFGAAQSGADMLEQATNDPATAGGVALNDAAKGAKMGAIAGPWGMAIGAAAGLVIGIIKGKPEWAKAASDVGRDFGVKISEALGKEIEGLEKSEHTTRVGAEILDLSKIISEAGGLNADNLDKMTGKLHDTFSMIETHQLTIAQGTKVLDDNWATFAAAGTDASGRISDGLKEIINLNDKFGTNSKAIAQWQQQQTSNVAQGFNAVAAALQGDQKSLAALGSQAVGAFAAMVASGHSEAEALQAIGPGLKSLQQSYKDLGLDVNDVGLKSLMMQSTINDGNPELMSGLAGLSSEMVALDNLGLMNIDTFQGMETAGAQMYAKLQAQVAAVGGSTKDALVPMQSYLHSAQVQATELGVPLDDNTQGLIDQSKELGIWKDAGKSANDLMLDGMTKLVDKVSELIDHLNGVTTAVNAIPTSKTIDIHVNSGGDGGIEPDVGMDSVPSFDQRPLERVTKAGYALLHPGDVVGVPPKVGTTPVSGTPQGGGGDVYHFHIPVHALDTTGVESYVEKKFLPAAIKVLRSGRHLSDLKQALS